jgi:hypothetical protein
LFNNSGSTGGSANLTFNLNQNLFSVGTSTLFANVTSGLVGIGTTSALHKLHITQAVDGNFPTLGTGKGALFIAGDTNLYGMYFGVNTTSGDGFIQTMRNNTATAYNLILNSAGGNVGIGTSSPGAKLHVETNSAVETDIARFRVLNGANGVFLDIGGDEPNRLITFDATGVAACAYVYRSGGTERMRLNASGNFLVGTTLSVGKIVSKTFSATESAFVGFQDSATTTQHFKLGAYDNGSAAIYGTQLSALTNYAATLATQLAFSTTNASGTLTEYMRLDSSGNLGIGTSGPVAKLDVVGGNGDGIQYRTSTRSIGIGQISSQASLFWGSSTDLTFFAGSELARLTSGGNLGLGTTSPTNTAGFSRQLQISGTTAALTLTSSTGGSNYSLGAGSVGDFGLWNNTTSSYRWYVDSSGNIGIGTSSPAGYGKFTVFGTGYIGHFNSTSGSVGIGFYENGTGRFYIKTLNGSDGLAFIDGDSTTEHMRIDASGNVGITQGNAPTQALNIYRAGSTQTVMSAGNSNTGLNGTYFGVDTAGNAIINQTQNFATIFSTNNTERARIGAGGNIFLNGSTVLNGFGSEDVTEIYYAGGSSSYLAINNAGTNAGIYASISSSASGTGATHFFSFSKTGTQVGSITTNGSATAYNTSSDRRLKDNIAPADNAGSVIDAIEVVKHDWKVGGHTRYGMIAQDLHTVAPEAVSVGDDGEELKTPWGVDYSKLVPMLVKEIQSLRARVAQLESK